MKVIFGSYHKSWKEFIGSNRNCFGCILFPEVLFRPLAVLKAVKYRLWKYPWGLKIIFGRHHESCWVSLVLKSCILLDFCFKKLYSDPVYSLPPTYVCREHFLDFEGCSWTQKQRSRTPYIWNFEPRVPLIIHKRFDVKTFIQLRDIHLCPADNKNQTWKMDKFRYISSFLVFLP